MFYSLKTQIKRGSNKLGRKEVDTLRIYFDFGDGRFVRFMWFCFTTSNELMMNCCGLNSKKPRLSYEYRTLFVSDEEARSITFSYRDAIKRGIMVDHITVHKSGKVHIKTINHGSLYIHELQGFKPIDQKTGVFLDMRIFSDVVNKYKCITRSPEPLVLGIPACEDEILMMSAFFSGVEFDLVNWVKQFYLNMTGYNLPNTVLPNPVGKYLQGIFLPIKREKATEENRKDYPGGTILAFFFNNLEGGKIVKAFHFE